MHDLLSNKGEDLASNGAARWSRNPEIRAGNVRNLQKVKGQK